MIDTVDSILREWQDLKKLLRDYPQEEIVYTKVEIVIDELQFLRWYILIGEDTEIVYNLDGSIDNPDGREVSYPETDGEETSFDAIITSLREVEMETPHHEFGIPELLTRTYRLIVQLRQVLPNQYYFRGIQGPILIRLPY